MQCRGGAPRAPQQIEGDLGRCPFKRKHPYILQRNYTMQRNYTPWPGGAFSPLIPYMCTYIPFICKREIGKKTGNE